VDGGRRGYAFLLSLFSEPILEKVLINLSNLLSLDPLLLNPLRRGIRGKGIVRASGGRGVPFN